MTHLDIGAIRWCLAEIIMLVYEPLLTIYLYWCHKPLLLGQAMCTQKYCANMDFAVPLGQWSAPHPSLRRPAGASCPPAAASKSDAGWHQSSLRKFHVQLGVGFNRFQPQSLFLHYYIYANTIDRNDVW